MSNIYPEHPSVALVISTHGSPAFIHLHLESHKRYNWDVSCLVVDDCSAHTSELIDLCASYGVGFISNPRPLGHQNGDLAAVVHGLQFAKLVNADLLCKMSRRFIPLGRWSDSLIDHAHRSQHHTFTNCCSVYSINNNPIPFRSECFGMKVSDWYPQIPLMQSQSDLNVEFRLLDICHRIPTGEESVCIYGFCVWDYLPSQRNRYTAEHLWHNAVNSNMYYSASRGFDLPYKLKDFEI